MKLASQMSALEVLGNRKWAAHLTVDQMRAQIEWEQHPDFEETSRRIREEYEAARQWRKTQK